MHQGKAPGRGQAARGNIGRVLLTGASLAAMGALAPAVAQDSEQDFSGNEIIVTASGREAVLQEVPIAVTALGAEAIENAGIQDLRQIEQLAPSYRFFTGQSNSAGTTAYIRGIGTGGDNPGFESAVGFFIDGVYRNRSGVALSELPEVERIEVLRGPQGTLFGRNTSAGAISVVTAGPEFSFRGFGEITGGDFGEIGATAGITGPVSDTLALRLEGNMQARDGYLTDVNSGRDLNNRDRWFLRGQALWDITSDATLRIIADIAETDEECCSAVSIQQGLPTGAINAIAGAQGLVGLPPVESEGYNVAITPGRAVTDAVEEYGISGELVWNIGELRFSSITSFRDWDALRDQDVDFSGIDRAFRDDYTLGFETFTQEFRLQGEYGRLDWLVGIFYSDEDLSLTDTIRFGADAGAFVDTLVFGLTGAQLFGTLSPFGCSPPPGLPVPPCAVDLSSVAPQNGDGQQADNWDVNTQTLGIFTHNEVSLTDRLTWTIGIRYNQEEKDLTADLRSVAPACDLFNSFIDGTPGVSSASEALFAPTSAGGLGDLRILICNPVINTQSNGTYADNNEENEWSGTTSLRYQFTPDLMVYGGYSRGYKAGGYNLDRSGFQYSLGLLTTAVAPTVADLQFDPEFVDAYELGFKSTLLDGRATFNANIFYQLIEDYQLNAFSGFNFVVFNVEEVTSQGVEIDFSYRPIDSLTFAGGALYNEATYETNEFDNLGLQLITAGEPLDRTPEWTLTGSVLWETPLTDTITGKVYFDARYNTEFRTATLNRNPITDNDAYATFNGRVGLSHTAGWEVEAFVSNITDEYYFLGSFNVPEQTGNISVYPSQPRTWGLTLRAEF